MTGLIWLTAGIVIGWITKIPFLLKWYKEFQFDKKHRAELVATIVAEEREIEKCRNDVAYFMEKYCLINGDPIFLRDYQKDFLKTWANSKLKEKT